MTPQLVRVAFLFAPLVISVGCASTQVTGHSERYQAARLPDAMRVKPLVDPRAVDLTGFATPPVSDELVARGDVLEVTIAAGLSSDDIVTFPARVNDQGNIDLGKIGLIPVVGLDLQGTEDAIRAVSIQRRLYQAPHVTVIRKQRKLHRIVVGGGVETPNVYHLHPDSSDLMSAILAAGGLSEDASEHVTILRPDEVDDSGPVASNSGSSNIQQVGHSTRLPLVRRPRSERISLVSTGNLTSGANLPDGSVVMVEKRESATVQVLGLVKKPGQYPLPVGEEFRVLHAIALAEGVSSIAADKISVIRKVEDREDPIVIQVSIREAKNVGAANIQLGPGDIVSVEQTASTVLIDVLRLLRIGIGASLGTLF